MQGFGLCGYLADIRRDRVSGVAEGEERCEDSAVCSRPLDVCEALSGRGEGVQHPIHEPQLPLLRDAR